MKWSRTSPHSPGPHPGTITTASGVDDSVDVIHRQELSTSSSSYCCCCEPELILPYLRADTMLSTRRARSAFGCRRRSLGVETTSASCARRYSGRGSIQTASPFSLYSTIGVPAVDFSDSTKCCCINTWYSYVVRVVSVSYEENSMLVFT